MGLFQGRFARVAVRSVAAAAVSLAVLGAVTSAQASVVFDFVDIADVFGEQSFNNNAGYATVLGIKVQAFGSKTPASSFGSVAYLDDVDKQILSDTFNAALDDGEDGETIEWSNPDTGHTGTIEVLDTHEDYGTTCRTIRTFTKAGGREGGGIYRLCLADDDTWQFAPKRRKKTS